MDSIFDLNHLYRTYFKMALPSVFGLMVSVVYNLADTFFHCAVQRYGADCGCFALCAGVHSPHGLWQHLRPGRQLTHFPPAGTGRP